MTDTTRTLHAVPNPAPEPLHGLTGHPADVYSQLAERTNGSTVTELALATGYSRSTVSKALNTLETHGLAHRTSGGRNGARRAPDHWHPVPTPAPDTNDTEHASHNTEHPSTEPTEETPENTEPDAPAPAPDAADAVTQVPHAEPDESGTGPDRESHPGTSGEVTGPARAPKAATEQGPQTPPQAVVQAEQKARLAPGALRDMVIAHLQAHPDEAFTATRISRVIEKSSGPSPTPWTNSSSRTTPNASVTGHAPSASPSPPRRARSNPPNQSPETHTGRPRTYCGGRPAPSHREPAPHATTPNTAGNCSSGFALDTDSVPSKGWLCPRLSTRLFTIVLS